MGRIPVVFVHGTYSSPGRWAEMLNVLDNDPRIHREFEPWFFFYNSGSPIAYSSYLFRKDLSEAVDSMDPSGRDACLRDMVVIGHSQGGLLTKMTVIDSGDRFWRAVSNKPFEEVQMTDEQRETIRQMAFVKPLPFVRRVVFIATPHRGSYLASRDVVRRLIASLVSLPKRLTGLMGDVTGANPSAFTVADLGSMTAVDNMSPKHRFIRLISETPIAPGVVVHSIIPVKGDGPDRIRERWRGRVHERAHRGRRVGDGRAVRSLDAGKPRDHRGSTPRSSSSMPTRPRNAAAGRRITSSSLTSANSGHQEEKGRQYEMRAVSILMMTAALGFLLTAAQAEDKPDATIRLSGGSMAVGVGIVWASGDLLYAGKTYPIEVSGLSVVDVGATRLKATGVVYNLKNLSNFDGNYTAAAAGATVAGGASAATMTNQNGVNVRLVSATQGLKFTFGVGGISMKIKE